MLIKCPECENEVSTNAKTCPQCGAKGTQVTTGFQYFFKNIIGYMIVGLFVGMVLAGTYNTITRPYANTFNETMDYGFIMAFVIGLPLAIYMAYRENKKFNSLKS